MKSKLFFIFCFLFPLLIFAQTQTTSSTTTVKNLFYCPAITALIKDPIKYTWSAPGGWKSYDISFVNKVKSFVGAQWAGANVGQITCVYKGVEQNSFPILLIFHTITLEPQNTNQNNWSKNLGGYRNCTPTTPNFDQKNCPFQIRLKPTSQNPLQQLQSIQPDANTIQNPGF